MAGPLIECVPNFSEGRDAVVVESIQHAIASVPGVFVLRAEFDPDHNRSVMTFAGSPPAVAEAAYRGIAAAVQRIDLLRHSGVHPRMGAADVVPFVPVEQATLSECVAIAHALGERVWSELGVPVYFYAAAALSSERAPLESVRRGGFDRPALAPDLGGPVLHPSAGACIIGARKFLIAFNVNLDTSDLRIAQAIARKIRASSGGLPFLKAIGVPLASRGLVQVSMNLTDFERTGLDEALAAVESEAARHGVRVAETEIIGLVPKRAIETAAARDARWQDFDPSLILENRLAEMSGG